MTSSMLESMLGSTLKEQMWHNKVRPAVLQDQHGRSWSTKIDTTTLHPACPLTPDGWQAPFAMLYPPPKYQTIASGAFGRLVIDYDLWLIDAHDAEREYQTWVLQVAKQQFGAAALQKIREGDADLRLLAGPPPASSEFIKAMKSGNKWALGIRKLDGTTYPMPPWAKDLVDTLLPTESWDGSSVNTTVDASAYPDVEDDALAVADRYAAAAQYADVEDDADPAALPDFQPLPRRRGVSPKERTR
jgi:hypothetical protein